VPRTRTTLRGIMRTATLSFGIVYVNSLYVLTHTLLLLPVYVKYSCECTKEHESVQPIVPKVCSQDMVAVRAMPQVAASPATYMCTRSHTMGRKRPQSQSQSP